MSPNWSVLGQGVWGEFSFNWNSCYQSFGKSFRNLSFSLAFFSQFGVFEHIAFLQLLFLLLPIFLRRFWEHEYQKLAESFLGKILHLQAKYFPIFSIQIVHFPPFINPLLLLPFQQVSSFYHPHIHIIIFL